MENNIEQLKAKVKEEIAYTKFLKEKYKYDLSDSSITDIENYIKKIEDNYRKLMEDLKEWQ